MTTKITSAIKRTRSENLFVTAKTLFPGGVNSPVRAFKSVGGSPLFIAKGKGSHIWDEDGNEFIDFCCSWGPLILGHAPDVVLEKIRESSELGTSFGAPTHWENDLAELILNHHRYIDKIRFVNSGTEAVMSAVRLARGYTGKNKVIKFEGCYHGHVDSLLVKAGSGLVTLGSSTSAGIPESYAQETIVLPLHNREAVLEAVKKYKNDIACIAIEPIPANNGLMLQGKEFLQFLRDVCTENNILLFFDEVISGFRVGFEGAAGYYGIQPDIVSFGKIIGGGLPVGAYAASSRIMSHISPEGDVYQAGTLSGNPVAMAAGYAQIKACLERDFYENLEEKTKGFIESLTEFAKSKNYPVHFFSIGSIFWLAFTEKDTISAASEIDADSMRYFSKLHAALLNRGVYMGPSGYEVGFISAAHTEADLEIAANTFKDALDEVFE